MPTDLNTLSWSEVEAALPTLESVSGGFTPAKRGIVTLADGTKVFVKLATSDLTRTWIDREREIYHWLEDQNYMYAPKLLAETDGGIALPDLSNHDWQDSWSDSKLTAVFKAVDALAELTPDTSFLAGADYGGNFWGSVPKSMAAYIWAQPFMDPGRLDIVRQIITNKAIREEYFELAATEPWKGEEVCHSDVRSDNFAFNPVTGEGLLVDWNWTARSAKKFDEALVLTNVYKSGYHDHIQDYLADIDRASLAYVVGFWLSSAMNAPDDDRSIRLRTHQVESAIAAHNLCQLART